MVAEVLGKSERCINRVALIGYTICAEVERGLVCRCGSDEGTDGFRPATMAMHAYRSMQRRQRRWTAVTAHFSSQYLVPACGCICCVTRAPPRQAPRMGQHLTFSSLQLKCYDRVCVLSADDLSTPQDHIELVRLCLDADFSAW